MPHLNLCKTDLPAKACLLTMVAAGWTSSALANVTSPSNTHAESRTHAPGGAPDHRATFSATGGNPARGVVLNDPGEEGKDFCNAPARGPGHDSVDFNGIFSFEPTDHSRSEARTAAPARTDGAGDTRTHAWPTFRAGNHASFAFTFHPGGGRTDRPANGTGTGATRTKFQTVSANVGSGVGPDDFHHGTGLRTLDNAALSVPEPSTWAALVGGLCLCVLALYHRSTDR